MAYPYTDTGYNMYDMLSMIQKSIRRCEYEHAGFAAQQLKNTYRKVMWNRLLVISAEDCFGILTKELIALKEKDDRHPTDQNLSNSVALLCRSKKSRDACYFACNFILVTRKPREIIPLKEHVEKLYKAVKKNTEGIAPGEKFSYDDSGFMQITMFEEPKEKVYDIPEKEVERFRMGAALQIAITHRDMDMMGYYMNEMRYEDRNLLWEVFIDFAKHYTTGNILNEIEALRSADNIVNDKKKDKDEIFISKAAIILCQANDECFETMLSSDVVKHFKCIDWTDVRTKPIADCRLVDGEIPEWVYDCHTLKGKKMGKTDWDMTTSEQAALTPLEPGYFDEASWWYIYEQDYQTGQATEKQMIPIREFAKTHSANPVEVIPYE